MKGLSRKNFSQAGHRSMIGSLQLATQGYRSGSTTVATPLLLHPFWRELLAPFPDC